MSETPKRPPGRPPSPAAKRALIPSVRCTPEQRAKWERLGGVAWTLKALERAKEPS